MNLKRYFIPLLVLSAISTAHAQSIGSCYERFIQEGLKAQENLDFDMAINKFEAANICPDKPLESEVDSLLFAVNQAKIQAITASRDRAEQAEQKALRQLVISESNRLAFIANQERERGNSKGALKLAFRAMQIAGDDASLAVRRAFGDAVFSSTLKHLEGHRQAVRSVAFSKDGRHILSLAKDSTVIVWNRAGEKLLQLQSFEAPVQSAVFSPDVTQLLTASGNRVELWDLQGQRLRLFEGPKALVYEAQFSHDGRLVAACSRDQGISLWDCQSGELMSIAEGYSAGITQLQFSADDAYLLGLSADKSVRIWNRSGKLLQQLRHQDLYFAGATFGPQRGQLLTYTVDHTLQIWDIDSGQLLRTLKGHQQLIKQVAVRADQSELLSCAADKLIISWDAEGQERFRMNDHLAAVSKIIYSNDGLHILSASKDGSAKLYTKDGSLIMNLYGFSAPVNDMAISPDNQHIVVVDQEASVHICEHPQYYYEQLKKQAPEDFTKEEKEKYAILDTLK